MKIDEHFTNKKIAELYDRQNPWGDDTDFYLNFFKGNKKIVDLGCGTGTLSIALAKKGHQVTGVDPSESMLEIAGSKPDQENVNWVCSNAQSFSAKELVNSVIMTGHVFQVLLTEDDILQTLHSVNKYLEKDGKLIFETRNPNVKPWENWTKAQTSQTINLNAVCIKTYITVTKINEKRITFEHVFNFPTEKVCTSSTLRFSPIDEIISFAKRTGFEVETIYGDWNASPFDQKSKEAIFVLKKSNV